MLVLRLNWHPRDHRVADGIRYIAHREERAAGAAARPLHAIGGRYAATGGDEAAIKRLLWRDGEASVRARYHRLKLTLSDPAARALEALPTHVREAALRRAVERTLAGSLPLAQGVYVTHSHGGRGRPHGHPHAHVHLSPVLEGGGLLRIARGRLHNLKLAWEREVGRALQRFRQPLQPRQPAARWRALLGRPPMNRDHQPSPQTPKPEESWP